MKKITAKELGINVTPFGKELLKKPSPMLFEFIEWFKKTRTAYVKVSKLSTYTDGEPYFFLPGFEDAEFSFRDFLKEKEEVR